MERPVSGVVQVECPWCKAGLPEEAVFCDECGLPLKTPVICPACQAALPQSAMFCDQCGVPLS